MTTWRVAKSLAVLREQVNARWPKRSKISDGTIGDAAHASRNSDHNPWIQLAGVGIVSAFDLTHDPANGCDAGAVAELLRISRDPRLKYVIFDRRIAQCRGAVGEWAPYTGPNAHQHHVHVSVMSEPALFDNEALWVLPCPEAKG